jgi:uncharacterized lipoprotein YbaY
MKRRSRIFSSTVGGPWMIFHNWSRATLLALAMLLAGCDDRQAHLPLPPAELRIAQLILHNVRRHLEVTGQTVAAQRVDLVGRV